MLQPMVSRLVGHKTACHAMPIVKQILFHFIFFNHRVTVNKQLASSFMPYLLIISK